MTTPATRERHTLAAIFTDVGPDAPTLCGEWTTRDLAAHIVVRDRRPDAAPGIVLPQLAARLERVQNEYAAKPWDSLVDMVAAGPPVWSPMRIPALDRLTNTVEFFVHTEDVRRATDTWEPRDLSGDLVDDLHTALRRSANMFAKRSPVGLVLQPQGDPILARDAQPLVEVCGPVPELVLFIYGRQAHAQVTYDGDDDAIEQVRTFAFGI